MQQEESAKWQLVKQTIKNVNSMISDMPKAGFLTFTRKKNFHFFPPLKWNVLIATSFLLLNDRTRLNARSSRTQFHFPNTSGRLLFDLFVRNTVNLDGIANIPQVSISKKSFSFLKTIKIRIFVSISFSSFVFLNGYTN